MKNLLIALYLFGSLVLKAQDSTTYVNVALKNGNSVSGQLLHKSDAEVSILTTDLGTGNAIEERLFQAYFMEGKNLALEEALVECGTSIGLDLSLIHI